MVSTQKTQYRRKNVNVARIRGLNIFPSLYLSRKLGVIENQGYPNPIYEVIIRLDACNYVEILSGLL